MLTFSLALEMSGHEDDDLHALFNAANDGIDHSEYKQTDDCEPLHFDSTNNFQDTFGTSSYDSERHSQVKKPTSRLNNEKRNDVLQQAWQHVEALDANEFIEALLNGQASGSAFDNRDSTEALNDLIRSGQFTDMYGSTVDFDHNSKGSKFKNHDDEDNQDIHGGNTSNACDDDIHGINSPGSSQASQNSRFYDKPSSSTSPAAPSPAETIVIQPTSPPLHTGTPSKQKEFTELEVFNGNEPSVVHPQNEYTEIDYSTEIIPRTTYASGIAVGPVQPQVILPSPIAAPPLPQTTVLADPLHANNHYSVDKVQLSNFLKENGRQVSGRKRKSKEEIERLIKRFCDPKELDYCTESMFYTQSNQTVSNRD